MTILHYVTIRKHIANEKRLHDPGVHYNLCVCPCVRGLLVK